jgi:lipid II:glycine glycyltransferase (peptidoglycan interpeptide bridge formation enzyme)
MVGRICVSPYWIFPEAHDVVAVLDELGYSADAPTTDSGYSTGLVDIRRSDDDIFCSFSKSARREIRRAERQNVAIRAAGSIDEAQTFFRYLDRMNRERGIIPVSYDEFKATFQHILEKRQLGVLLNAFGGEMFLGGLWIVRGPTTAHTARYVVAPKPLRELSNLSIGPVLWWSGIKWAKEKGCSWLDVEGYADNADPSNEKYLVYEFKKKFSPQPVYGLGHYIRVCQPFIYSVHKSFNFLSCGWRSATGLPYKIKKKMCIPNLRREST